MGLQVVLRALVWQMTMFQRRFYIHYQGDEYFQKTAIFISIVQLT